MQESVSNNTMVINTVTQYREVVKRCKDLYVKKAQDYGTSWRVLRPISIVDQIYIKAWRIRQIQEKGIQKIKDSIESEFIGIVNYGIIVAELDVPYIAMHMQGTPKDMQVKPIYADVVIDVNEELRNICNECKKAGIKDIIVDPGFGSRPF